MQSIGDIKCRTCTATFRLSYLSFSKNDFAIQSPFESPDVLVLAPYQPETGFTHNAFGREVGRAPRRRRLEAELPLRSPDAPLEMLTGTLQRENSEHWPFVCRDYFQIHESKRTKACVLHPAVSSLHPDL